MRPQAGVDRLKPVPPMHANYLPLVAQAVSPANRTISHLLSLKRGGFRLIRLSDHGALGHRLSGDDALARPVVLVHQRNVAYQIGRASCRERVEMWVVA